MAMAALVAAAATFTPPPPPPPDCRVGSAQGVQSEIDAAIAEGRNASVCLEPGARLRFSSPASCNDSIHLSVRSGGELAAILDGGGASRIFVLSDGCSLSLQGLRLANGRAEQWEDGGAIKAVAAGDIELSDVTFSNCSVSGALGGAVFVKDSGKISMNNVGYTGCSATAVAEDASSVYSVAGGAVYVENVGSVVVAAGSFADCTGARGGGMFLKGCDDISMTNVTVTRCSAVFQGGGLYVRDGNMSMINVTYTDCSAGDYGGAAMAMFADQVLVSGTTFERSKSTEGGALYLLSVEDLDLFDSRFFDNWADAPPSALFYSSSRGCTCEAQLLNTSFVGNAAPGDMTILAASPLTRADCRLGYWMPNLGQQHGDLTGCDHKCAAGHYGNAPNLASSTCSGPCPKGHYCPEGTVLPVPCPEGTRMPNRQAVDMSDCMECAPGEYQSSSGSSQCLPCRPGSYTATSGATECIECSAGGYCDKSGAATSMVREVGAPRPLHMRISESSGVALLS